MNRNFVAATVAAVAALACSPAFSQATYISGAIGGSHANIDCTGADSCKDTAFAGKAIVGYDFGNQFAVEGMFVSLGKPTASVEGVDIGITSSYWGLGGAWRPEFGQGWSGVFRLGAAFTTSKLSGSIAGAGPNGSTATGSQSYHSTSAYAGLGVAYEISKGLKIEGDLDSTQISILSGSDKQHATAIDYTLGLTYQF